MQAGKDYIGVGCGAIVFNDKQEVLLLKRTMNSRNDPGMWARPGGEVDFGEMADVATIREIFEETGINIKIERQIDFVDHISEDGSDHWIALGFLAYAVSGTLENKESKKHDEVGWFALDNLPSPINHHTRVALEQCVALLPKS